MIPDWKGAAVCAQTDPELFFPAKGERSSRAAKEICLGCDVRAKCLEYALEHSEGWGIWGGYSATERRHLKRGHIIPAVVERLCEVCGKTLWARGGRGPARFCSSACREKRRIRARPKRLCKTCGHDLPGGRGRYVYCSTTCRQAAQCRKRNVNTCQQCGVTFKANGRVCYCSAVCRTQGRRKAAAA